MKKSRRTQKIASVIKKNLGRIISKEISNPRMGLVTVTDVDVAMDLSIAKVYFTIIGGEMKHKNQVNTIKNLDKFLRKRLSDKIELKHTPQIRMIYDETPRKAQRVEKIIKKIKQER
ncbi:MAG: 30S ribosome-binding factor RbfA [Elusimicrobiota bacterium]